MKTSKLYKNVVLGQGSVVEDYCILGAPPRGRREGDLPLRIGEGALIRSHTVIYGGNVIGRRFQTGNKVNIRESNTIGDNVSVGTLSVIEHHVTIGNDVRIHTQAFVRTAWTQTSTFFIHAITFIHRHPPRYDKFLRCTVFRTQPVSPEHIRRGADRNPGFRPRSTSMQRPVLFSMT